MSTPSKYWFIRPQASPQVLRSFRGLTPVIAQVLLNRGFENPDEAQKFLYVKKPMKALADQGEMKDARKAAERLKAAIQKREKIIIYGDFDADGVTSTVLMVEILQALGAVVQPYIPHRVDEGYGLNSEALYKLAAEGAKVVMTVDCGIRSVQEVEDGKAAGLDMIITDHHSIGAEIPDAYAVVNPKQLDCNYYEDMLAGVGVAYKIAGALLEICHRDPKFKHNHVKDAEWIKTIITNTLDLVAIGTVADLAPLNRAENRALVRLGLEVINSARRPGVKALLDVSGIEAGKATAMSIGFSLGPRINAAGRLDDAMIAYRLLSARDVFEAASLADDLHAMNTRRQELTRAAQAAIREQLALETEIDRPLIFAGGEFQPGIVGLVAGRLVEEYYRPSVVMEHGASESRASCRSIPQFDITGALDQCADLLVRHGGHPQAAGFTVLNENLPDLKVRLLDLAQSTLQGQELRPTLEIDSEVDINQLSEDMVEDLELLEPTGFMNNSPILMSRNVYALEWRTVGTEGRHLKLKIARAGKPPLDAIGFGLGDWINQLPCHFDVAFQLEINEWNGNRTLQLNVQDIRLAGVE